MQKITLSPAMLLAIDDAKRSGDINAIRKTENYRVMLADMDKQPGRTHEQNVQALDEFCRQAVINTPVLLPQAREVLMQTLRKND